MSQIHDRVMVALAVIPGKQRTVREICKYVNANARHVGAYSLDQISDALLDLSGEGSIMQHPNGRWMVADGRRKGGSRDDRV